MHEKENLIVAMVRALPPWAEFGVVVTLAFGWFIVSSISVVLNPPYILWAYDWGFIYLIVQEIAVGCFLAWFLHLRGWRLRDLGFDWASLEDGRDALILIATSYAVMLTLYYFMPPSMREAFSPKAEGETGLLVAFALSIVNGAFEEAFVCAYVLSAWRGSKMWSAITASALLRLAYHLYQGPMAVVSVGPLGLIFGWFYATKGRIWPLIFAHALLDFVGLLALVRP